MTGRSGPSACQNTNEMQIIDHQEVESSELDGHQRNGKRGLEVSIITSFKNYNQPFKFYRACFRKEIHIGPLMVALKRLRHR